MGTKDLIGGGVFTALGIFILLMTFSFPSLEGGHPGPSLFPRILGILFIIFGGVVLYRGFKPSGEPDEDSPAEEALNPQSYINPFFVLLLIIAYMIFSNWFGFLITSFLVLFFMMIKLRVSLLRSVLISILLTLFVNLMFAKILRVPLPPGFLQW